MHRRDFLKLAAASSLAVLTMQFARKFPSFFPGDHPGGDFAVQAGGKLFRGTSDGRLLVSTDGGLSWRCKANFGENAWVRDLAASGDWLFAEIEIPGGAFALASADGVVWRTFG